jgi:hypothetical protein
VRLSPATLGALTTMSRQERGDGIAVDAWAGAFTLLAWLVAMQGGRRLKTVPILEVAGATAA